jgi:SPP1 gp7 family putative phage head morphogenesis protein
MNEVELKGILNELVDKIVNLLKITVKKKDSDETITKFYNMGHDDIEVQFGLNLSKNSKELAFLKDYSFDNITSFNADMKDKLRKELSQGMLNSESQAQISKRVSKVISISRDRAKMIVRTETNRTFNMARQSAAEKSGLKLKKYVIVAMDNRTSPICTRMNSKYGDTKQAIPLDRTFKDNTSGQVFQTSPFHPNCRTRIAYTPY